MNISMLVLNNFINDSRVHKEAAALSAAGNNVTVVALWQPGLLQNDQLSGYTTIRMRLRTRQWKNRLLAPIIKYLEFAWQVWRHAGRSPAQVYHANDANTLPAAWLAARRNRAKLVYDAHELESGRNFSGFHLAGVYKALWTLPEKLFIRQAQAVITVSPSIADEIARLYKIPTPHVILNCPEKANITRSTRLREELHIPEKLYILVYQGRVAQGRGIEAFLIAIQDVEDAAGVILGDGPELEGFRNRIKAQKWQRVYLPGEIPLSDLVSYTSSADIGIVLIQDTCLSYRLSLPNKLFEYLHASLPVICSDLPEIARLVRDYQVGILTDPEEPSAITKSIKSMLNDPGGLAQMRINALKAAEAFNWQNESKKLVNIYEHL